ncbi:MAG: hypothetical protein IPH04_16600 [Saprospirales bacterium]|nr:hypothetical protein [Saprospirales bacterium]
MVEENSNITGGQGESSYRYTALRSQGNVEVLRDDTKNLGKVPGYFKQKDLDRSIEAIRKDDDRYTGTGHTAINIHLGGEDSSFSQGCQNIPPDQYPQFIKEVQDAENEDKFLYLLIDASKLA